VLWEVYSYELAGAAGLPVAAADLLMVSSLSDVTSARQPLSVADRSRPGTTTAVYRFSGSVGSLFPCALMTVEISIDRFNIIWPLILGDVTLPLCKFKFDENLEGNANNKRYVNQLSFHSYRKTKPWANFEFTSFIVLLINDRRSNS